MHIHISSEFRTLEHILPIPQHRVACSMKSVGRLCEPVPPLADLPLSQAKEMDHLSSPCLLKDDDWKDSSGRVRAVGRGEQVSFSMSVIASVTKCHWKSSSSSHVERGIRFCWCRRCWLKDSTKTKKKKAFFTYESQFIADLNGRFSYMFSERVQCACLEAKIITLGASKVAKEQFSFVTLLAVSHNCFTLNFSFR